MIRKLTVLTVFSVSVLFCAAFISADQTVAPNGALPQVRANDKLLFPGVITQQQKDFERGMAEAGWDIHKPQNLLFYNVRHIIQKNDIMSLQSEIDQKIAWARRASRIMDSSA